MDLKGTNGGQSDIIIPSHISCNGEKPIQNHKSAWQTFLSKLSCAKFVAMYLVSGTCR